MAALQVEHEQSLAGLIEAELAGPAGQHVAIRNSGVDSWGPAQYLSFTRERLKQHRYGMLVVAVFVGNDIVSKRVDYVPPRERSRARWRLPTSISRAEWIDALARPLNDYLEERSHLLVLLKNRFQPLRIRLGLSPVYLPRQLLKSRAQHEEWTWVTQMGRMD